MKKTSKSKPKRIKLSCEKCGGTLFKNMTTTYPLNLLDRQIMVHRVSVKKCLNCQTLLPTTKGKEKLERCLQAFWMLSS